MTRTSTITLGVTTTLLLLLGATPLAQADNYPAGSTVEKGDADHTPWPSSQHDKVALCGLDLNGDQRYSPNEPLYLNVDSTTCSVVGPKDVRLVAFEGLAAGKEVRHEDLDRGLPLLAVAHKIRYTDVLGKAKFETGNGLYLDVLENATLRVGNGDLRLVAIGGHPAFSVVQTGDPDAGYGYSEIATGVDVNSDSVIYKAGSAYYVNADAGKIDEKDHGVEDHDVRLNDKAARPPGGAEAATGAPELTVTSLTVLPAAPTAGQPFRVTIEVQNTGDVTGSGPVATHLDGETADARGAPTLAPGETTTLVVTLLAPSTGPVTVSSGAAQTSLEIMAAAAPVEQAVSQAAPQPLVEDAKVVGGSVDRTQEAPAPTAALMTLLLGLALMAARRRI